MTKEGSTSLDDKIKKFWIEREDKKKLFYWKVQKLGFCLLLLGLLLYIIASSLFYAFGAYNLMYLVLLPIANLTKITGNCIYSCVPVEELDIIMQLLLRRNNVSRNILSVAVIAVTMLYGLVFMFLGLYDKYLYIIAGAMYFLTGVCWIPNIFYPPSYNCLSLQFALPVFTAMASAIFPYFQDMYTPEKPAVYLIGPIVYLIASLFVIVVALHGYNVSDRSAIKAPLEDDSLNEVKRFKDIKSRYFSNGAGEWNAVFYCAAIAAGINLAIVGVLEYCYSGISFLVFFVTLFSAFEIFLPLLLVIFFGPAKCFWFIAYFYEYNKKTLIDDGAFMAELISKCSEIHDENNKVYWLKRKMENKKFQTEHKKSRVVGIKRQFWMKATIIRITHNHVEAIQSDYDRTMELAIHYADDEDDDDTIANYTYSTGQLRTNSSEAKGFVEKSQRTTIDSGITNSSNLVSLLCNGSQSQKDTSILPYGSLELDPGLRIKPEWDQWEETYMNFTQGSDMKKLGVDIRKGVLYVECKVSGSTKTKEELKNLAKTNLRKFDMANFNDTILEKSPRDLTTDLQKEAAYGLSSVASENCRIDYFVSHSWEDSPIKKCLKLREFSSIFKGRHGRTPLLWLDKVCIDQKDPSLGLSVLPININACDKFLILLSKTYICRLWCVWELFTLFCFVSKESVVFDRIDFLVLDADEDNDKFTLEDMLTELRTFDINKAMCFGPNEEFQLRYIILKFDPTGERMKGCFSELANLLEKKIRGTFFQRLIINTFSRIKIINPCTTPYVQISKSERRILPDPSQEVLLESGQKPRIES